jgi:XTP/dITP diphosphohydrolase
MWGAKFIMQTLLIATRNGHKTREIGQMLGPGWEVRDLTTLPMVEEIEETGDTFEENAALKALTISRLFPDLVMADDSGLEVDALEGAPGIYSSRFAGEKATDASNRHLLAQKLRALRGESFPGRFRCVIVLASGNQLMGSFAGAVEGSVITTERGSGGFGYDSMFIPYGYTETFGELKAEVKNGLSHRGRALAKAMEFLRVRAQS